MRWCADAVRVAAVLASVAAHAPSVAAQSAQGAVVADHHASAITAEIAARWGVAPDRVRLEWGAVRGDRAPAPDAAYRLVGSGASGDWVVSFEPPGGPSVAVRLRAGVEVEEPVAARDLERGEVLGPDAIEVVPTVRGGPPAPRPSPVAGWVARRRIGRGQPLREPAVGPPRAVEAGEPVQVVWRRTGLAVTLPGRALGSAAAGQSVAVRTETGKRMHGTAVGNGVVQVDALSGRVP